MNQRKFNKGTQNQKSLPLKALATVSWSLKLVHHSLFLISRASVPSKRTVFRGLKVCPEFVDLKEETFQNKHTGKI